MADSLSRFLLVLIGLIVSFDVIGPDWLAILLAFGFVLTVVVVAVFKTLTLQEEQRAPAS